MLQPERSARFKHFLIRIIHQMGVVSSIYIFNMLASEFFPTCINQLLQKILLLIDNFSRVEVLTSLPLMIE